jgi:PDZ domain/Aspartyl protease
MKDFLRKNCTALYCFVIMCLCGQTAICQEVFSPGPAKFLTRFGFDQLTGGVVILRAALDNYPDSLNFILDTGSGGISLDSTTTIQLKIPTVPSDRTIRGIAGLRTVNFANDHTLKLPGLEVENLNFHINDYEILTGVYGIKIDGIIGFSFLRRYMVKINYDKKEIEIFKPGDIKYPRGGYLLKPSIAGLPMQYAEVRDNTAVVGRFYLDTGAGLCLLFSNEFVSDSSIFKSGKRRYPTVAEGLGGKTNMDLAVLKNFKLGKYSFRNVPIYLFDDDYNVTSYPHLGGLIGNDILRRFNVIINYPRSEIHLLPNAHFRDPFDYSYTGLGLYQVNGRIEVTDVLEKSPADQAGLKVGDILVAVDNNLSNSMQAYKNILMDAGRKIRLVIRRDDELMQKTMFIDHIK